MKEKSAINEINKGLNEGIKKRGVKVGTKRGNYNTKKDAVNTISNFENVSDEQKPVDNGSQSSVTETTSTTTIKPEVETNIKPTESVNSAQEKYNRFLKEYGTPKPDGFDANKPDETNETKTENKSYDFTKNVKTQPDQSQVENNMQGMKKNSAMLVNGYMLMSMCDFVFPILIVKIYSIFDDRAKSIKPSQIKLDKDQKDSLKESADIVASWIFEKIHPMLIFVLGMGVMYSSNMSNILDEIPKIPKRKKEPTKEPTEEIEDKE